VQAAKYASYQVHVYGGISIHGGTDLHFVIGTTKLQSPYKQVGGRNDGQSYKGVCAQEYKDVLLKGGKGAVAGLVMQGRGIFSSKSITDWVFQQDMPRIHVAAVQLLRDVCPHVLPWPCNSPEFNLIENVWSLVQYHLNHDEEWHDLESFKQAVVRAWEGVTLDTQYLQTPSLFQSMHGRLQQCIASDGGIVD
jgi:hypothetical protein